MVCDEFSPVAAELALGVLTGRARAEALAHLEECGECRETLRRLAQTGEDLLQLLPPSEPPPGFELRVLDRLGQPVPRPVAACPGARRSLAAAAVTVAVLAAGLGGWGLRGQSAPPSSAPRSAALVADGHSGAGHVYYYAGSPRWMYMWVDLPGTGNRTVTCQVRGADGRYATVASFPLNGGYGSWGSLVPEVSGSATGARLLGPGGTVLATARF